MTTNRSATRFIELPRIEPIVSEYVRLRGICSVSALLTPSFKGKADRRCYVSTYNKVDTYDRDQCRVEEQIGQRTKA